MTRRPSPPTITYRAGRLVETRPVTPVNQTAREPWWAWAILYICLACYVLAVGAWLLAGAP